MVRIAHLRVECKHCGKWTSIYVIEDGATCADVKCEHCKKIFTFGAGMMYDPVAYVSEIPLWARIEEKSESPENDSYAVLHVRFSIAAVGGGAYGKACYQFVFTHAPVHALVGCAVSMGDSNATLAGREDVCIIGLAGSAAKLRSIMKALTEDREFQSVGAKNPLVLNGSAEPLVDDGVYTEDGSRLAAWAKAAFDSVKENDSVKNNQKNNNMRCKNCGWENPVNNAKCEKCNASLSGSAREPDSSESSSSGSFESLPCIPTEYSTV
jgi:transcription elongation factor Elf1